MYAVRVRPDYQSPIVVSGTDSDGTQAFAAIEQEVGVHRLTDALGLLQLVLDLEVLAERLAERDEEADGAALCYRRTGRDCERRGGLGVHRWRQHQRGRHHCHHHQQFECSHLPRPPSCLLSVVQTFTIHNEDDSDANYQCI